ncbi:MAG: tRNA preQ1(34) S-adenosylmethionine ribosyltransferase-isomerase QueA [Hydrogenophaga sp.]|uniref:tRNA preQ1(34) S-adenosylmethionine ribosyltransferase-isomerase QueA n=1 Tax=Hydrogenophaga sp. TaxID=1904254 RepID=UPI00271DC2B7|nr:tRNA preQ1(34) S-adenosylmethionine ribosyltransferase-isomerase QueA [Hydrogenophaga sp.]MDO9571034.1 tRNA preQ1(34) S-adenosylmethionine ribosyltransferase-isomerase QueA [Hydrogenophaga sp.]MDP3373359.1 tRNA preQ1(34) S-adenosylmethionine ribosyltransferase-isomerase QueA [Hydrogenophaga sp.]
MHTTAAPARAFVVADFDFSLPEHLIAQHPAPERSASRLLDATGPHAVDRIFRDLPSLLQPGDLLVFNDTQVVKARLFGEKASGGKFEILIERVLLPHEALNGSGQEAVAHIRVSKKPQPGGLLHLAGGLHGGGFDATFLGRWPDDNGQLFRLRLQGPAGETPYELMARHGHVPLPPYITHSDDADDERRYQTVFARVPGAVAAPTAALHFDEGVLAALQARGVQRASVTLHVGAGTFAPMKTEQISEHVMHHERYAIPPETLQAIADCRARGGRVVAVGTTTVRTLESWAHTGHTQGDTNIFITPGFEFRVVALLVTNFHLPKSTLMMLVSAFAGYERVMDLYRHAVAQGYRFFSYGDAMLLRKNGCNGIGFTTAEPTI